MTTLEEADLAVLPADWEPATESSRALLREFAAKAQDAGKPVLVFIWGDFLVDVPFDNAIVFANSLHRSRQRPYQFAAPVWHEDFITAHLKGALPIRQKSPRPTVGFCGFANPLSPFSHHSLLHLFRKGKAALKQRLGQKAEGILARALRTDLLRALQDAPGIDTNFIIRHRYWDGAVAPDGTINYARMRKARAEYLENMLNSDYILCSRGAGNFSFRLYETLSCGRIPIFVDTDSVLPYDFAVDWKKYCVWIEPNDIAHIGRKVAAFHASLSPDEFVERQRACRALYETWIAPEGFFGHFDRHFTARGESLLNYQAVSMNPTR